MAIGGISYWGEEGQNSHYIGTENWLAGNHQNANNTCLWIMESFFPFFILFKLFYIFECILLFKF